MRKAEWAEAGQLVEFQGSGQIGKVPWGVCLSVIP